jgi:ABC-2 type transport system permease protein
MQSTASFFSASPALIRENLRRFWAVPAFGFLGYFFSGVFPLLMNEEYGWYHTLRAMLQLRNPGFVFFGCLFPLIAAVVLQRYLFAPGAVAVMHSLPFTRHKLFNSNFLSGLLLVWLPILVTCLLCLLLKRPDLDGLAAPYVDVSLAEWERIASVSFLLSRFALMLLASLFVYTVCVLAGMVTGNTALHLIVCALLNGLLPSVVLLGYAYCVRFLFGFDGSAAFFDFVTSLSPAVYFPFAAGAPGAAPVIAYIVATAALWAFAQFLYAKRPLEKAGDSVVFAFMECVFCFFAALAGMTALAYYFEMLYQQSVSYSAGNTAAELYFYAGMVVGALVFFALARIIVKKSPRIWNRETGVQFGAFALIALILFAGLRLDLFGYERRVPAAAGVAEIAMRVPTANYNAIVRPNYDAEYSFRDAASIEAVTAFHRRVAENRNTLRGSELNSEDRNSRVTLRYTSARGAAGSRAWTLPTDFLAEDASLRTLVESEEFRAQNSLSNPAIGQITDIHLRDEINYQTDITLSSAEFAGFTAAVNADLRRFDADMLFDPVLPLATINMRYLAPDAEHFTSVQHDQIDRSLTLSVSADFENTVAWLSERGYYDKLTAWRAQVRSIRLMRMDGSGDAESFAFEDPALIETALNHLETAPLHRDDAWRIEFSLSPVFVAADGTQSPAYDAGEHAFYLNPGNPALDMLLEAAR